MTTTEIRDSVRRSVLSATAVALLAAAPAAAQTSRDTTVRGELPRLEIPEITIVGKKAITLPFARKGEIYDVPSYEAPPADTGLLAERPFIALPPGSLPRYEQREMPWRVSLEGSAGRHGTFGGRAYVDYHTQRWNLSTTAGFRRTDGHVANSAGDEFLAGGRYTALVTTDNDVLRNFRVTGDLEYRRDSYGMPGLALPTERTRNFTSFGAGFSSIRREGLVMDFTVKAGILDVSDAAAAVDSGVTVTSPALEASVTGDLGAARLITGFRFASSSPDYPGGVPSPSLYALLGALQWRVAPGFFLRAGAEYAAGNGTDDVSRSRLSPIGELEWEIDAGRKLNLRFRPRTTLESYGELAATVPYLAREVAMIPEERTVDAGATLWYNSGMLTLEITGEYSRSDNRPLFVTDSGRIRIEHGGTWQGLLRVEGSIRPRERLRLRFHGSFRPAEERGGSSQLPMTPVAEAGSQAELDLTSWWTLTGAARYWSRQNLDRAGLTWIGGAFVLDAGISTTIIPRVLLSAGVRNLLDDRYQWWAGYPARGIDFHVTAKARL